MTAGVERAEPSNPLRAPHFRAGPHAGEADPVTWGISPCISEASVRGRISMRRAFSLVAWMGAILWSGQGLAQTGPVAPGAEVLPNGLREWAETPLVLTPVSAPDKCLDMSDQDPVAQTVQMWTCTPRWNQKVWIEPAAARGEDVFRVRIGKLACVLDSGRSGARATMGICNDAPSAEYWTVRDGQLVGASGLCLDAPSAADGTAVVASICDAGSASQQWRLEAMRTALNRLPGDLRDPSGFGPYFYSGYLADRVEEFRPRFMARTLTAAERAEIKTLMAPWSKIDALQQYIWGISGESSKRTIVRIPWSTLRRLSELGESGDRAAMRAAMEAFALVRDSNYSDTFPGWEPSAFPHADDSRLAYNVANRLANIWAAHYWQQHGPDRLAAAAFTSCHYGVNDNCMGYTVEFGPSKPTSDIYAWIKTGKSKFAFSIQAISFHPAGGSPEERHKRFVSVLDGSAFSSVADFQHFGPEERAVQAVYAEQTGQLALWDNVRLNSTFDYPNFTSAQEGYMRTTLKARADAADWRARFEAFMAAPDSSKFWSIQQGLLSQSDADLLRFAEQHTVTDEDLAERLCGNGRDALPSCQRSRQYIAQRRAEYDRAIAEAREIAAIRAAEAQAAAEAAARDQAERDKWLVANSRKPDFWDQLAGLAEGFAAAAEAGNEQVTVRTYDSEGNFLGSETMTRSRAMGMGAQTSD